jgi:hypothetical protein
VAPPGSRISDWLLTRCRNPSTLIMVDLAAKSAKKVYKKPGVLDLEPFAFEQVGESKTVGADILGGSVKATTVSLYKGKESFTGSQGDDIRVVVVAIRGTATIHDWLVNFNDLEPNPTEEYETEFLVSISQTLGNSFAHIYKGTDKGG